jgi:hypothetical protein
MLLVSTQASGGRPQALHVSSRKNLETQPLELTKDRVSKASQLEHVLKTEMVKPNT